MNKNKHEAVSLEVETLSKTPISFLGDASGLERFFKLEHRRVRIGEREDDRIIWVRGDFVLIVAVTSDKRVVLINEYKQAIGEILTGLPAGAKKKNETPQEAALRELQEETGYIGLKKNCSVLGPFFNSPDKSTEKHFVVMVSEVVKQDSGNPEKSETILGVELCSVENVTAKLLVGMHRMAFYEVCNLIAPLEEK